MKSVVVVAISEQESLPRAQERISQLQASGFEGLACVGAAALRETLHTLNGDKSGGPLVVLVLLDGGMRDNCAAAQLVTTLYPECGVVSLLESLDEESSIMALQSGADLCCAKDVSAALLTSVLYSLLRRCAGAVAPRPAIAVSSESWQLAQQACLLEGPQGLSVSLTTAERAFLVCLTGQPDMRASHEALMRAIDPGGEAVPMRAAQARLGVLVSRLRRKLHQQHGLELPVKSVHKWGYMFTGELRP